MNTGTLVASRGKGRSDLSWFSVSVVVALALLVGSLTAFYPESFFDVSLPIFWALVLALVVYHIGRRSRDEKWLRVVFVGGLLIRYPAVLAHLVMGFWLYQGELDFPKYFLSAVLRAQQVLAGSFEGFELPLSNFASGRNVVSELLTFSYFLVGPSLPGMLLVTGFIGFMGSYFFLRAFQAEFSSSRHTRFLALSLFFFPSLVFWTGLLGKDSLMFFFLGLATYSISHLMKGVRLRYLVGLIVGITFATFIRPPVGVVLILATGVVSILMARARTDAMLRPVLYTIVGLLAGGVIVAADPFRQYLARPEEDLSLPEQLMVVALHKHVGQSTSPVGSNLPTELTLGSDVPTELAPSATFFEIVRVLPGVMFTFLFRPHLFEANNPVALVAALDAGLLLALVLWRVRHLLAAIRSVLRRPFVAFCALMFLLLASGLAFQANWGIIVRQRTMVLPFLFLLLAVPRPKRDSTGSSVYRDRDVDKVYLDGGPGASSS